MYIGENSFYSFNLSFNSQDALYNWNCSYSEIDEYGHDHYHAINGTTTINPFMDWDKFMEESHIPLINHSLKLDNDISDSNN